MLHGGGESRDCVFLDKRDAVYHEGDQASMDFLQVHWFQGADVAFHKVGQGSAGVGLHSGHLVTKGEHHLFEHTLAICLLELFRHIVSDLSNRV